MKENKKLQWYNIKYHIKNGSLYFLGMPGTVQNAKPKTIYEIIEDYAQYSTIQGLIYIFISFQSLLGFML